MGLLDYRAGISLNLSEISKIFSKEHFTSMRVSIAPLPLSHLVLESDFSHKSGMKCSPVMDVILVYLIANNIEHPFIAYWSFVYVLCEAFVQVFHPFY